MQGEDGVQRSHRLLQEDAAVRLDFQKQRMGTRKQPTSGGLVLLSWVPRKV